MQHIKEQQQTKTVFSYVYDEGAEKKTGQKLKVGLPFKF